MAVNPSHDNDWQSWDFPEAITLTSVKPRATDVSGSVATAYRTTITKKELQASNGAYVSQDLVFHVPISLLPAGITSLKLRDKVTDAAGTVWTVLEASPVLNATVWRLVVRDPIIVYDLRQKLTIKKAKTTQTSAAGRAVRHLVPKLTGVPARFQPVDLTQAYERGKLGDRATFTCYVDDELTNISMDDLAYDDEGRTFEILAVRGTQSLGNLSQLDLVISV